MSGLLGWIKGHLLIVISGVLILVFLPAGFFGSRNWNGKIRASAESAYKDQDRKLSGQQRVQYALPAVLEDEPAVEETRAPNARVTAFYAEQRQAREEQVSEIVERATAFNSEGHEPLIDGLFPEAPSARRQTTLIREFMRRLVGDERQAGAYDLFVRRQGAGSPPDPEEVTGILSEAQQRLQDQLAVGSTSTTRGSLTPEQQEAMQEELSAQRVALYAARADELAYYILPDAITGAPAPGDSVVPRELPAGTPPLEQAFKHQWDYWVITDVLRAVAAANADELGSPVGVPGAPVKRVDRVAVREMNLTRAGADDSRSSGTAPRPTTYTGRSAQGGQDFDVRMVRLEAVVAPAKLPQLFNALARTNYMTVTGVQIEPLDPWAEIEQGYFFGSDHVARAVIDIETVWLRSWTAPLMPPAVREALGVTLETDDQAPSDEP